MASLFAFLVAILFALLFYAAPEGTISSGSASVGFAYLTIEGEPIARLAQSRTVAEDAYVASESSLFHKGSGESWSRVADVPPAGQIVFAADDPAYLLAGEKDSCGRGAGGSPLHTSVDGGVTWAVSEDEFHIRPLAVWHEAGLVVGADCQGLLVSTDLGESWTIIDDSLLGFDVTAFAVVEGEDQVVLAGLTGEGGTSQLFQIELTNPASPVVSESLREYWGIGAPAGTSDTIYLASITGLASSSDSGETWEVTRTGLEDVTIERDPAIDGLPPDFPVGVYGLYAIHLDDGSPAYLGTEGNVYVSSTGDFWLLMRSTSSQVTAFAELPDAGGVLAQTEDGVIELPVNPPRE